MQQGSTTHCVDTDQRRIPLPPAVVGANSYSLALPADPGIIIPGMWWLFAIDPAGVPSVGFPMLVRLQPDFRLMTWCRVLVLSPPSHLSRPRMQLR